MAIAKLLWKEGNPYQYKGYTFTRWKCINLVFEEPSYGILFNHEAGRYTVWGVKGEFKSLEMAQATAQADFEFRVRSCVSEGV